MKTFGNIMKELRNEATLTQQELANILNVHKGTISHYEKSDRFPDQDMLIKIAEYFNVSVDYLLGRVEQRTFVMHKDNVEGHEVEYSLDKDKYPDGLNHEEVLKLLEQLKEMGMDFSKFKKD
ncbi:MAG: DNA-binding helix-turn-helix protein [Chlamydiales bacterium]|jgi:transcriptional regulator with XRE-family HTH domain|nr:DNA-binding helix-turn-helix protein [Chlamydiales bacterium]